MNPEIAIGTGLLMYCLEISGGRKYDENGLKKIIDYPAAKRKEMVETYYKFTMVRNPFERLLSGYRDKGWNGYFPDKVRLLNVNRAHYYRVRD